MAKTGSLRLHGNSQPVIRVLKQIERLDSVRQNLVQRLEAAVLAIKGHAPTVAITTTRQKGGRRKGFKLSAEARAKISAAQKKRWAKTKAGK